MDNKNWIYFGIFIDENAKHLNEIAIEKQGMDIPFDWKTYNHHMTIAFNNGSEASQKLFDGYKQYFGKSFELRDAVFGEGY